MKKQELFIRFLVIALACIGWATVGYLPLGDPEPDRVTQLRIETTWPFASALRVEEVITSPLEQQLSRIPGIMSTESRSEKGRCSVTLELENPDDARDTEAMVRAVIRSLVARWPVTVGMPEMEKLRKDERQRRSALEFHLESDLPDREVYQWVQPRMQILISRFPGIRSVEYPAFRQAIQTILVHPEWMKDEILSPSSLGQWLSHLQQDVTLSSSDAFGLPLRWRMMGTAPSDLQEIEVPVTGLGTVSLGSLARIEQREIPKARRRINGKDMLGMHVFVHPGKDQAGLSRDLQVALRRLEQASEGEVRFVLVKDRLRGQNQVRRNVLVQCGLAIVVLGLFLWMLYSCQHLLFLFTTLATTLGLVFLYLWLSESHLSVIVTGSLTMGLGMIVDNGMMLLSIDPSGSRKRRIIPLLGATASTMIPLLLISQFHASGQLIRQLATPMIVMLGASLLVSWAFLPMIRPGGNQPWQRIHAPGWLIWMVRSIHAGRKWIGVGLILLVGIPIPDMPDEIHVSKRIDAIYEQVTGNYMFREVWEPRIQRWLGGLLRPFLMEASKEASAGEQDGVSVHMTGNAEAGTPGPLICETAIRIEQALLPFHSYYDMLDLSCGPGSGMSLEVGFNEWQLNQGFPLKIYQMLVRHARRTSGMEWHIHGVGDPWTNRGISSNGFQLQFHGYHLDALLRVMESVYDSLSQLRNVVDVRFGWENRLSDPGVLLAVDHGLLAESGSSWPAPVRDLILWNRGVNPDGYLLSGDGSMVPYTLRRQGFDQHTVSEWLQTATPSAPPPGQWLRPYSSIPLPVINKKDQQYQMGLHWSYAGSARMGKRFFRDLHQQVDKALPPGLSLSPIDGEWEWDQALVTKLLGVLPVLALIYVLGVWLMESWRYPLMVLLMIPLGYVGPMGMVIWTDVMFGPGMLAGLFLVTGLMVNHAMFLLVPLRSRIHPTPVVVAGLLIQKWRPLVLTTLSTCLTFGPFLWQSGGEPFWRDLAICVLSGMLPGTVCFCLIFSAFVNMDKLSGRGAA